MRKKHSQGKAYLKRGERANLKSLHVLVTAAAKARLRRHCKVKNVSLSCAIEELVMEMLVTR